MCVKSVVNQFSCISHLFVIRGLDTVRRVISTVYINIKCAEQLLLIFVRIVIGDLVHVLVFVHSLTYVDSMAKMMLFAHLHPKKHLLTLSSHNTVVCTHREC